MAPPRSSHTCEWRDYTKHLEGELAELSAQVETLRRAFQHLSERLKRKKKLPEVEEPPRTGEQTRKLRKERESLRNETIETVTEMIPVPEEQKRCPSCEGGSFRRVGKGEMCERISYIPGHFRRTILVRETMACRCGGSVVKAPAPERWSDKTVYDASFVAYLMVSKCFSSIPLYRLEKQFALLGIACGRSTMNDLFRRGARKLLPLAPCLALALRQDYLVHVDETSFKLTSQTSKAFVWTFVGSALTGYRFETTRGGSVPVDALGDSEGAFCSDDYRGYDPLESLGNRRRCGCMAHARRKFFEAGEDPSAQNAMGLIQGLYAVERHAKERGIVGTKTHLELRRTHSRPLFLGLCMLSRHLYREHGPKTLLGRAGRYTWKNFRALRAFLTDARIPLDNNAAENALRRVAIGRKNYLFVHSKESGQELALLLSLVESCRRQGVNALDYLTDVLSRIDDTRVTHLRELLPDRWTPRKSNSA